MPEGYGKRRIYGLCVVLLGCLLFAWRGYKDQLVVGQSCDFKPVYAGARCLVEGCDPYDSAQIAKVFLQRGGDPSDMTSFIPYNANYPPSALGLVVPFALLPFGPADLIWLAIGMILFSCAACCMADLCIGPLALAAQFLLALFVASSTLLIMFAQPAMMATSFVVIAVWCFLRQRFTMGGVISFGISLALKPHIGALVWLYFLLAWQDPSARDDVRQTSFRRLAYQTFVAAMLLMVPGTILALSHPASSHWLRELHTNLAAIAGRGNLSDPGPANDNAYDITSLQTLFSMVRDQPGFYYLASLAAVLPLFASWLYMITRPVASSVSRLRNLLAISSAASMSFLPIYHREYDTRLLLVLFPTVALLSIYRIWGRWAVALSAMATVTLSEQFIAFFLRKGIGPGSLPPILSLLVYRRLPLTLLLMTLLLLYAMFVLTVKRQQSISEPATA